MTTSRRGGPLLAIAAALLLGLAAGCAPPPSDSAVAPPQAPAPGPEDPPPAPPAGLDFVEKDGATLTVGGRPWRFVGYNLPCANPFVMDDGELDHYLDVISSDSGATVVRAWFFQSNGGPGKWGPFDRVLAAFGRHRIRVVPALTDEWNGGCDAGAGEQKTIDWFEGGYRTVDTGHDAAFRDFAVKVAERYAGNPTIAFWQLVNEAQANTRDPSGEYRCDNEAAQKALRVFADDMVSAIKTVDHNHLVNLGTIGGNQCGLAGDGFTYVHDGAVDICEYHDYGASASALPGGPDQLAQRLHECATLPSGPKPLFVGESGIQGNVQPDGGPAPCTPWPGCTRQPLSTDTLVRRATFFDAKIRAAVGAGAVGYLLWVKSPFYDAGGDIYAIGDRDPTEQAMKGVAASLAGGSP